MNQVKHRFASHTYATRSCLLTVVAIRFQVPIDNSVQGMMVTADSRGNRVRLVCISPSNPRSAGLRSFSWIRLCRLASKPVLSSGGESGGKSIMPRPLFFPSCSFALARLKKSATRRSAIFPKVQSIRGVHLFWNQICVCRSCIPRLSLISLRRPAVGLRSMAKYLSRWTNCSGVTLERFRFSLRSEELPLELSAEAERVR